MVKAILCCIAVLVAAACQQQSAATGPTANSKPVQAEIDKSSGGMGGGY